MNDKMFDCVTETCNFLAGRCHHNCKYCWALHLQDTRMKDSVKYHGPTMIWRREMKRKFKPNTMVFVCDMNDLFGEWVHQKHIEEIINYISKFPETTFLLLTKNPKRYGDFVKLSKVVIPSNCILGTTIETNRDEKYETFSNAPKPSERIYQIGWVGSFFRAWANGKYMVSIEPIMDFDLKDFVEDIKWVDPDFVYIGYDNYNNDIPEPSLNKVEQFIKALSKFTEVREKPSIEKRRQQQRG